MAMSAWFASIYARLFGRPAPGPASHQHEDVPVCSECLDELFETIVSVAEGHGFLNVPRALVYAAGRPGDEGYTCPKLVETCMSLVVLDLLKSRPDLVPTNSCFTCAHLTKDLLRQSVLAFVTRVDKHIGIMMPIFGRGEHTQPYFKTWEDEIKYGDLDIWPPFEGTSLELL